MQENNIKMKPFVKWVGGKTQLLDTINLLKPKEINKFIEPFVGGGAVFFNFAHNRAIINDINKELITAYKVIRDRPNELINLLNKWNESDDLKEFFQNLKSKDVNNLNELEIAARLIFLNKYGFNGIYRVNSKGQFNVPFANKNKTNLYDDFNIVNIANYLKIKDVKILNNDYKKILRYVEPNDFLFVDPPYFFEKNKGFNSYNADKFTQQEQKKLFKFLKKVEIKGAKWILTNNNHPFIRELYKDYFYFSQKTNRFINCNGQNRINAAEEIFILNYIPKEVEKMLPEEAKKELEFHKFLDTFISTNIKLDDYVDWTKVDNTVENYQYDLKVFNLLHSKDEEELQDKIHKYWFEHLSSFKKFYILLAGRYSNSFLYNKNNRFFKDLVFTNSKEVIEFLKVSNLIRLFIGDTKVDFNSYMQGIEVGLDSNSRKNRSGKIMENNIAQILKDNNVEFEKQCKINLNGVVKKFDFKFTKDNKDYYVECNFYNASGSKLNEVTRSYIGLNKELKQQNYNFVWVTDGAGWNRTKKELRKAFFEIENIFSIELFKEWISSF